MIGNCLVKNFPLAQTSPQVKTSKPLLNIR